MATMNTVHEGQQADSSVPYIVSSRYYVAPLPAFTKRWLNMPSPREICSVSDKLFHTKSMMKLVQKSSNANLMKRCRTGVYPLECLLIQQWKVHQRVMAAPQKSDMQEVGSDLRGPIFSLWLQFYLTHGMSRTSILPCHSAITQRAGTPDSELQLCDDNICSPSLVAEKHRLTTSSAYRAHSSLSSPSPQLAMISFSCLQRIDVAAVSSSQV